MNRIIKRLMVLCLPILFFSHTSVASQDCVILLHGLVRTSFSMSSIASTLSKHHYYVVNDSYPSTKKPVKELAKTYIPIMINKCLKYQPKRIHFITHSMGGIVLQNYLQANSLPQLSHIVMLGPPNHGSPLADQLHNNVLIRSILGPAISDLTTKRNEIKFLKDHYKIGIIAGNLSFNPLGPLIFHEPNDGKVAVSSTQLKRMDAFIVLPVNHTFMMRSYQVQTQILHFLKYGNFAEKKLAFL